MGRVTFVIYGYGSVPKLAGDYATGGGEAEAGLGTRGVVSLTRGGEARQLAGEGGAERVAVGNVVVDRGVNDGRVDNRIHADRAQDSSDADWAHRA
jgi:hypothetical protein